MNLKEKLDIVLITYNRKEYLENTFEQIFAENSPIKDLDITVLDNCSTDGTSELIELYSQKFPNIKHVIKKVNIGGCANIAKAIVEIPTKDYAWVICDNDTFYWQSWNEIEQAITDRYNIIMTRNCKNTPSGLFYTSTFVPSFIFKTSIINDTLAENIYDFVPLLFPHLAVISDAINRNYPVFIPSSDIIYSGINPNHSSSFTKGLDIEYIPETRKNIFWSVGYFCSTILIKDKKVRTKIIDDTRHFHKSLFELFKSAIIRNKIYYNNYSYNLKRIFEMLNFKQKLKFIAAYLYVNLSFKNYKFYDMRSEQDWIEYVKKVDEQKYINKLGQKLNGKKILLYGAGLTANVLIENYDLSGLNVIGISDKRFENSNEQSFFNYKTIKPSELKNYNFDTILYTLKLYKNISKSLQKSGIKQKGCSLVKHSNKYEVRT